VRFTGRGAHASVPETAANPHYAAARFLLALEALPMPESVAFGPATVAPTLYRSDQTSANVIPEVVRLTLEARTIPGDDPAELAARLAAAAEQAAAGSGDVRAETEIHTAHWRAYTGYERSFPAVFPAFELPEDHAVLRGARAALEGALGRVVPVFLWRFATDGGHFMAAGIPTVGYGPGDERLAHTTAERIGLDELAEGLLGNAALAASLGDVCL
jgi:acetylornithine deacetylase/succinyl-diaminopimelate desuccinylase-like protein